MTPPDHPLQFQFPSAVILPSSYRHPSERSHEISGIPVAPLNTDHTISGVGPAILQVIVEVSQRFPASISRPVNLNSLRFRFSCRDRLFHLARRFLAETEIGTMQKRVRLAGLLVEPAIPFPPQLRRAEYRP